MKILIVTRESDADKRYGLGKSIKRIADGLNELGHETLYFSKADCAEAHEKWFARLVALLSPFGILAGAFAERLIQGWSASKVANHARVTHVWFQDPWLVFGFNLRQKLTGRFKKKFALGVSEHGLGSFTWAVTQDGICYSERLYRLLLKYEKRVLLKSDWVWSPSNTALNLTLRDLQIIHCPTNWQALHYGRPELTQTYADAPPIVQCRVPLIMAVGRVAPVKNYFLLIDALSILEKKYNVYAKLVILGEGDSAKIIDYAKLQALTFTPEIKVVDHVFSELAAASVYTSACDVESFGLANREAVAFGLPCVVASGGASCEVLDGGAWLVPPKAALFAEAYYALLTDRNTLDFWQKNALKASLQWASWKTVSKAYEQSLKSI